MRPTQLASLLSHSFEPKRKRKVLVKGKPGIGKTDIVKQAAEKAKCELLLSHPAISDPTDFKGMPAVVSGKNGDGARAEFLPFGDLNRLIEAKKPTVCFIDDIGQAPHSVQAALMQLLQGRHVNGHKISDHVVFCGATNDTSHRAGVNALLEPVKSRWDTIVELEAHIDDWCEWAFDNKMPAELIAFLRFRPKLLCDFAPTRELTNSPSPRTAEAVGNWLNDGIKDYDVISGCAGEGFASELIAFLKVWADMPNIDAILLDPNKGKVPSDPATLYAVTAALATRCTKDNCGRVFTYLARLPKEFEVCAVRDVQRVTPDVLTTKVFTEWAVKNAEVLS